MVTANSAKPFLRRKHLNKGLSRTTVRKTKGRAVESKESVVVLVEAEVAGVEGTERECRNDLREIARGWVI